MAEVSQGRLSVRSKLDRNRPASGFCYELEGVGVCDFDASSFAQDGGYRGSGYAGWGGKMNTIQALIGASIFALAVNAAIEVVQRTPDQECVVKECVAESVLE